MGIEGVGCRAPGLESVTAQPVRLNTSETSLLAEIRTRAGPPCVKPAFPSAQPINAAEKTSPAGSTRLWDHSHVSEHRLQGIEAEIVHVEVNAGEAGEPKLILVGLPDAAVKESDDRVFSALSNGGFRPPRTRTTINLAPGNLRKEGPFYDLPIALGILAATRQLNGEDLSQWLIAVELSLSDATRPVRRALAMARLALGLRKRGVLLPAISAEEAALVEGVPVFRVDSLDGAVRFLTGEKPLSPVPAGTQRRGSRARASGDAGLPDFSEIKGQHALRRAVEVAVAGNHNLLILGPIPHIAVRPLIKARKADAQPRAGQATLRVSRTKAIRRRGERNHLPTHSIGLNTNDAQLACFLLCHLDMLANAAKANRLPAGRHKC